MSPKMVGVVADPLSRKLSHAPVALFQDGAKTEPEVETAGKVDFGTGTGRPPGTYASTAKKRQIHWYRPLFSPSPLHGLFR